MRRKCQSKKGLKIVTPKTAGMVTRIRTPHSMMMRIRTPHSMMMRIRTPHSTMTRMWTTGNPLVTARKRVTCLTTKKAVGLRSIATRINVKRALNINQSIPVLERVPRGK